jgi:hypothetical protein
MGGARSISRLREIDPGDTHHLARGPMCDGYRCAPPILRRHRTAFRARARHNLDKIDYDKRSCARDVCQYLRTKESMYVPKEVLEYFIKYKTKDSASQI